MTDIAIIDTNDKEKIALIKDQYAKGATDMELALFIETANRVGLSPLTRQIYLVPRWDTKLGRNVHMPMVSIDGFRLIAQRSEQYEGQDGPYFCDKDGKWSRVWPHEHPPFAAKVGVYRKGFKKILWSVVHWSEYVQKTKDGRYSGLWGTKPCTMLAKVAESVSLRRAFAQELSGLYTPEEMGEDVVTVEQPAQKALAAPAPIVPKVDAPRRNSHALWDRNDSHDVALVVEEFKAQKLEKKWIAEHALKIKDFLEFTKTKANVESIRDSLERYSAYDAGAKMCKICGKFPKPEPFEKGYGYRCCSTKEEIVYPQDWNEIQSLSTKREIQREANASESKKDGENSNEAS
jgi:phage recombination protein Bet